MKKAYVFLFSFVLFSGVHAASKEAWYQPYLPGGQAAVVSGVAGAALYAYISHISDERDDLQNAVLYDEIRREELRRKKKLSDQDVTNLALINLAIGYNNRKIQKLEGDITWLRRLMYLSGALFTVGAYRWYNAEEKKVNGVSVRPPRPSRWRFLRPLPKVKETQVSHLGKVHELLEGVSPALQETQKKIFDALTEAQRHDLGVTTPDDIPVSKGDLDGREVRQKWTEAVETIFHGEQELFPEQEKRVALKGLRSQITAEVRGKWATDFDRTGKEAAIGHEVETAVKTEGTQLAKDLQKHIAQCEESVIKGAIAHEEKKAKKKLSAKDRKKREEELRRGIAQEGSALHVLVSNRRKAEEAAFVQKQMRWRKAKLDAEVKAARKKMEAGLQKRLAAISAEEATAWWADVGAEKKRELLAEDAWSTLAHEKSEATRAANNVYVPLDGFEIRETVMDGSCWADSIAKGLEARGRGLAANAADAIKIVRERVAAHNRDKAKRLMADGKAREAYNFVVDLVRNNGHADSNKRVDYRRVINGLAGVSDKAKNAVLLDIERVNNSEGPLPDGEQKVLLEALAEEYYRAFHNAKKYKDAETGVVYGIKYGDAHELKAAAEIFGVNIDQIDARAKGTAPNGKTVFRWSRTAQGDGEDLPKIVVWYNGGHYKAVVRKP